MEGFARSTAGKNQLRLRAGSGQEKTIRIVRRPGGRPLRGPSGAGTETSPQAISPATTARESPDDLPMSPLKYSAKGRLTDCLLLSFRTPRDDAKKFIPRGFKLLTHNNMAFWNVCACRVEGLHPGGLPFVSFTYHLVSYRLHVRVPASNNHELRGMYNVRTDVDHGFVKSAGNMTTDMKFESAKIALKNSDGVYDLAVEDTRDGIGDSYFLGERTDEWYLEADSCFADADEARRVLRHTPQGLSLDKRGRVVDVIDMERDDGAWKESPMRVARSGFAFFKHMEQPEAFLELATAVDPLVCTWRIGGTDLLN